MSQLAHATKESFRHQLAHRLTHVAQKTIGHLAIINNESGERGQIAQHIVAATFLELLTEYRRPVLRICLPAIEGDPDQAPVLGLRSILNNSTRIVFKVQCHRFRVEFVAFQASRLGWGRHVYSSRVTGSDARHSPGIARRSRPHQIALRVELTSEVDDAFRRNRGARFGGQNGRRNNGATQLANLAHLRINGRCGRPADVMQSELCRSFPGESEKSGGGLRNGVRHAFLLPVPAPEISR